MLDIKLFRENPELIFDSEKKRFRSTENAEKVIEYDTLWREGERRLNSLRAEKNKLSKSFKQAKKDGNIEEVIAKSKEVANEIKELSAKNAEYLQLRDDYRYKVGNIIDEDVPISDTEDDNVVVRTYGEIPEHDFELLNHVDLINKIDGADLETAASVSGARFYYLKRDILHLNLALIQFALSELEAEGYIPMQTPFFVKGEVAAETSELGEFEETLYKVENEDMYLIATAEQTLAALHRNEIINPEDLPLRYCALSTCFRKEAGSHGKDTLGIFRVHQFEKIEQFIFCDPEDSKNQHEKLMEVTERIYQKLGLPYQIIAIVSSALNDNAAIKYDLEAWFPGSGAFRELVSCTNCKDYQARKTKTRVGRAGSGDAQTLHTLNSTAIATERTMCCILENYQQADGSVVVKMGGTMLLATVTCAKDAKEDVDFMPLQVDYKEKYASAGRFPGGFMKREGKASDYEILIARLVDRALRPLFPEDFHAEVFVNVNLISAEKDIQPDALAGLAASSALAVSDIPFEGPISEVRVARIGGEFKINPNFSEMADADLDIMVAATIYLLLAWCFKVRALNEGISLLKGLLSRK